VELPRHLNKLQVSFARMKKQDTEASVQAWLDQVSEDLKTASALLKASRYTWCAFICQQALEKCLKAGYVKKFKEIPPYTHKLEYLCQLLELDPPEDIIETIITIDKYYIATRYPSYKKSMNISNKHVADNIFKQTKRAYKWLLQALELAR